MDDSIPRAIIELKSEFSRLYKGQSLLREVLPLLHSEQLPIDDGILQSLRKFAVANPIYVKAYDMKISGIACKVYEGDINNYWLSSKKYDTSYQPFYPTWILSAYALARGAKLLGFEELIDVGSGDGRVAYCASILGIKSYGIEIDRNLVELQNLISDATEIKYNAINADATLFDYSKLELSNPIFFISALPEMGEMLANSVISRIKTLKSLKNRAGFNFMGSHVMKSFTRDRTSWGWGNVIASHKLEIVSSITLPTLWTTDQAIDTAYVYTRFRNP